MTVEGVPRSGSMLTSMMAVDDISAGQTEVNGRADSTGLWDHGDRGGFAADARTLFHGDARHVIAGGEPGELQHGE
jgi:hypothetical protein